MGSYLAKFIMNIATFMLTSFGKGLSFVYSFYVYIPDEKLYQNFKLLIVVSFFLKYSLKGLCYLFELALLHVFIAQ